MAIVNRDFDASEQREVVNYRSNGALVTGTTAYVWVAPFPGTIQSVKSIANGVSGAMAVDILLERFTSGGNTFIAIGISALTLVNMSLSGPQSYSGLAATGSTLLNFQAGDGLVLKTSVANSATTDLMMNIVVKKTQDILSLNGSQT